jgi:hypothetical protein
MYAILDAMNKALDAMDECMKWMFVVMLLTVVGTVAGFMWGLGSSSVSQTPVQSGGTTINVNMPSSTGVKAAGELAGAIGVTGGLLTNSISQFCNIIQQWYKMLVEKRKMNVEMIKMELCLQVMRVASGV